MTPQARKHLDWLLLMAINFMWATQAPIIKLIGDKLGPVAIAFVPMFADHHQGLVDPRVSHVSHDHVELREADRNVVEQNRQCVLERRGSNERRSLMDHHRQPKALAVLVDLEHPRGRRVDVLVDRPSFTPRNPSPTISPRVERMSSVAGSIALNPIIFPAWPAAYCAT